MNAEKHFVPALVLAMLSQNVCGLRREGRGTEKPQK